ncbi:hypothetical protein HG530_004178 [Fusarium avenaceum]|nr:hypothetical protein HG530_004178 [Fusarium avenaceum]
MIAVNPLLAEPPVLGRALPLEGPGAGAPQIPALLFSLANWPSAGPALGVSGFFMPPLALPQRAPKASPPAAGAGLAEELMTGFMLAIVVGVFGVALEVLPMPEKADVVGGLDAFVEADDVTAGLCITLLAGAAGAGAAWKSSNSSSSSACAGAAAELLGASAANPELLDADGAGAGSSKEKRSTSGSFFLGGSAAAFLTGVRSGRLAAALDELAAGLSPSSNSSYSSNRSPLLAAPSPRQSSVWPPKPPPSP